jgi:hypothetical protein
LASSGGRIVPPAGQATTRGLVEKGAVEDMFIDLDDPLWGRLYGPYREHSVPQTLRQLQQGWSDEIARDLFWEQLHHQEDLYPVTYAALPWLWRIAEGPGRVQILGFMAWTLRCAVAQNVPGRTRSRMERYWGLSLDTSLHQKDFLPRDRWLTAQDLPRLAALQDWLDAHAEAIATTAVQAMAGQDRFTAGYLALGLVALRGDGALEWAIITWLDGMEVPDAAQDRPGLARELAGHAGSCPEFQAFLLDRAERSDDHIRGAG